MRPPIRGHVDREHPASAAGEDIGGQRPRRYRSRDLRIDATPEEVVAAIGAGTPKVPHEWNYLTRKPLRADSEAQPQRRSKPSIAQAG